MGAHSDDSAGDTGVSLAEVGVVALYNAVTDSLLNAVRARSVATAYEDDMAKKTISKPKTETKAETPAEAPPAKPRTRARAPKAASNKDVAADNPETTSVSMASEPSEEQIRLRAYHRYLERGGGHGMDFEDWLEAKRELRELNELNDKK